MPIPYGGQTKARVHTVFNGQVEALIEQNSHVLPGLWQAGERAWMTGSADGWNGNISSPEQITKAHSRSDIGTNYEEVVTDPTKPGTVADSIGLRLQNDMTASLERATLCQEMRPTRACILAAARRRGHAHPRGVLGNMVDYVTNVIRQGAIKSQSPGSST